MSYETAVSRMFALGHELAQTPSHKFDLKHMRVLLAELERPERRFRSVLIAGTNGKGSTAAALASILRASGIRAGLYTSPHLLRMNERIRVNGAEIGDDEFAGLHRKVDGVAEGLVERGELPWHPSFFEMMTAIAFEYFAQERVEIAVLEVGMGGRLDATNVVEPLVSVITDISLDHMEWLGSTIDAIAREKAGILRANGVMVTLPQHREANEALGEVAVHLGVRGVNAAGYIPVPGALREPGRNHYPVWVMGEGVEIDSPLSGQHQQRNIALAIATATELCNNHGYNITAS